MKEYMKPYENFYTGKNRKAMFHIFSSFIELMKNDDYENISDFCTDNCEVHISTIGHLKGIKEIQKKMKWPGPFTEISRATILNFVARSHGNEGQQTAYVQCSRSVVDNDDIYPFFFGYQFSNHFILEKGIWKLDCIRADLCYTGGNDMFVFNKWELIDHIKYKGHEPMINPELDNPWIVIPDDDELQSDEEEVVDLMFRFTWAFDMGDFEFMKTFITTPFLLNEGPERKKLGEDLNPGDRLGFRSFTDFLRYKYHKEAHMMHAYRIYSIEINDDYAIVQMIRGEEHRNKNRVMNHELIHSLVSNMTAVSTCRRDYTGEWKMASYRIEGLLDNISEYTRTDDSRVLYDEYFLEEKI